MKPWFPRITTVIGLMMVSWLVESAWADSMGHDLPGSHSTTNEMWAFLSTSSLSSEPQQLPASTGDGISIGSSSLTVEDDEAFQYQGRSVQIDVLANDGVAVRGGSLAVTAIVRNPQHGSATIQANGEVLYVPSDPSYFGVDTFRYQVTNSQSATAEAEVEVTLKQTGVATRGRPIFMQGSLRADNGELLRGAYWNMDLPPMNLPTQDMITKMPLQGFNTLHVYAESHGCGYEAGSQLGNVMMINNMVKDAGLYLIITIGNGDGNGPAPNSCSEARVNGELFDTPFAQSFWQQYSQVFAEEPHVIFEVLNEPYHEGPDDQNRLLAQPSPQRTIDLQVEIYLTIREYAPATPVLLFTYSTLHDLSGILLDLEEADSEIQMKGDYFSNTGIAFHGYTFPRGSQQSYDTHEFIIRELQLAGYDLVMTENRTLKEEHLCVVPGEETDAPCIEAKMIYLFEQQEVSWTSFIRLNQLVGDGFDEKFRNQIDYGIGGRSVVWAAEAGDWPARFAPPVDGASVFLQSQLNEKWVSTSQGLPGTGPLVADRDVPAGWEAFVIDHHVFPEFCLKSRFLIGNGADDDGVVDPGWNSTTDPLIASARNCGRRTLFDWLVLRDGSVVLRAPHYAFSDPYQKPSWRFVSVEEGSTHPRLLDNSTLVGEAEKFTVLLDD